MASAPSISFLIAAAEQGHLSAAKNLFELLCSELHIELTSIKTDDLKQVADFHELIQTVTSDQSAKAAPALSEIVDLRFFCGFTFQKIAAMKNFSERTAQRHWEKARIYLHRNISAQVEI